MFWVMEDKKPYLLMDDLIDAMFFIKNKNKEKGVFSILDLKMMAFMLVK